MTSISTVNPAVGFLHCLAQGHEALQHQLLSVLISNLLMLKTTTSPPAGLQDIVQEAMASAERDLGPFCTAIATLLAEGDRVLHREDRPFKRVGLQTSAAHSCPYLLNSPAQELGSITDSSLQ